MGSDSLTTPSKTKDDGSAWGQHSRSSWYHRHSSLTNTCYEVSCERRLLLMWWTSDVCGSICYGFYIKTGFIL
jgi:hypothetical protein